jgi:pyruvate decarboxylase
LDLISIRSNELNAAYAADGYARVKEGLGVLVTTYASH